MSSKSEMELRIANQDAQLLRLMNDVTARSAELRTVSDQLMRSQHDFKALQDGYARMKDLGDKAIGRADVAIKERDEALAQFDELKARLFAAEAECNRLRGYIDRVQDRDRARDGASSAGGGEKSMATCATERRPHWTSFGQRR